MHVGTHECPVGVIPLQEGYEGCGDADYLHRGDVHVLYEVWWLHSEGLAVTGLYPLTHKLALIVQGRVGLGDNVEFLLVGGQVGYVIGVRGHEGFDVHSAGVKSCDFLGHRLGNSRTRFGYCLAYSRLYDLSITILRYGIPYGPRARGAAVIPIFVSKALKGEPLTIAGDGSQFRKFIYVEDLAEGNVLALKSIAKNKIYNLEGKEKVTIKQIAETVQKLMGDVKIESVPARPGDFSGKEISSELAKKELDWEPKVSFKEGVKRYIEWYKQEEEERNSKWAQLDEILRSEM